MEIHHAYAICGIVAHLKDRSASMVALRCRSIAGACLEKSEERAEVLQIVARLKLEKWPTHIIENELELAWGWERTELPPSTLQQVDDGIVPLLEKSNKTLTQRKRRSLSSTTARHTVASSGRTVNPLASADFNLPNHPYQNWYEPPNKENPYCPPFS